MMLEREKHSKIKRDEDGLDLNRQFLVEIYNEQSKYSLEKLPEILNFYGTTPEDLMLLKQTCCGYVSLGDKYRYHILCSLDKVK